MGKLGWSKFSMAGCSTGGGQKRVVKTSRGWAILFCGKSTVSRVDRESEIATNTEKGMMRRQINHSVVLCTGALRRH